MSEQVIDLLLFCPQCGEQHVDEAKPGVCETCGKDEAGCPCPAFAPWLNPPHKSHRCGCCNYVWRPADVATNGVAAIRTRGERDGTARPRYYATAADYERAVRAAPGAADSEAWRALVASVIEVYQRRMIEPRTLLHGSIMEMRRRLDALIPRERWGEYVSIPRPVATPAMRSDDEASDAPKRDAETQAVHNHAALSPSNG